MKTYSKMTEHEILNIISTHYDKVESVEYSNKEELPIVILKNGRKFNPLHFKQDAVQLMLDEEIEISYTDDMEAMFCQVWKDLGDDMYEPVYGSMWDRTAELFCIAICEAYLIKIGELEGT